MRIKKTKSKNKVHYSIIKDITKNGKRTTKIFENIGNEDDLIKRANGEDPISWLNSYVNDLNKKQKAKTEPVIIKKYPNKLIVKDEQKLFNVGYLFPKKIYYDLSVNSICNAISEKYKYEYDLNEILSYLIFSRIIFPSSKLKTFELSKKFLEQPSFEIQHIYRALEVICKEGDFIQSELYKNSSKYMKRNNKILYYDCTNFFFEIEQEDELRKYGVSKEHRPNPIVEMGLFMDGDGIPLSICIHPGNTSEQKTLKPLEEKIIKDFKLSHVVVCTDAGLASKANRKFNNKDGRCFITTQSIKKLKSDLKEWALSMKGWKYPNQKNPKKTFDITDLNTNEKLQDKFKNTIFYKERWIKDDDGFEQKMIVTFSLKYKKYQENIREGQIERAKKLIEKNPKKIGKPKQNDFKRFINNVVTTDTGEVAENNNYSINEDVIKEESKYDGFYAVCTNLEDDATEIVKVNHRRWEIEESFRIMKTDFESRPVYLSREDRITAHFITCFIALIIFRYIEKKLDEKYTVDEIIELLREMYVLKENENYLPAYTRTDFTDELHEKFGFRTDYEVLEEKYLKKIFRQTKK